MWWQVRRRTRTYTRRCQGPLWAARRCQGPLWADVDARRRGRMVTHTHTQGPRGLDATGCGAGTTLAGGKTVVRAPQNSWHGPCRWGLHPSAVAGAPHVGCRVKSTGCGVGTRGRCRCGGLTHATGVWGAQRQLHVRKGRQYRLSEYPLPHVGRCRPGRV